ncbi:MAG TPA: lipid II flippase MurJ, partial [Dehalococcoidia bacterium]
MSAPPSLDRADEPLPASSGGSAGADLPARRSGDHARALTIASAIVAATYFGSRVLGALRTTAIAHAFGTPPELDAYYIGNRIPDLLFQVIAGATLASAFIPTFARVRNRRGEDAGWRLASAALNLVTLATAL